MTDWYQQESTGVVRQLETDAAQGLSQDEATLRQQRFGLNELIESGGRRPARILWEQLSSALVLLLIVAAAVSAILHETTDAIVIVAIVILNAGLGFFQDYRAERAMAALKKLAVPVVRVRREGHLQEISARQLVPGDLILLEVGSQVPADCRLMESVSLRIQESTLTGESEPVEKQTRRLSADDLPVADRSNMAFMGTVVTYGHGQAVVTETGMRTQLGHIAASLQSVESEPTPLQARLAQLGRTLALVALAIVAVLFALGMLRGEDPRLMLMTALSLAVAVVPEGLPAVATVTLALGARRMFRHRALIRKLPAVETLGSVTAICSDKTGTLTENRMTVTMADVAGHRIDLSGIWRAPTDSRAADAAGSIAMADSDSAIDADSILHQIETHSALALLLVGAGLCNDAELECDIDRSELKAIGDPTEGALAVAAARLGMNKNSLLVDLPRVGEVPFDSDRKRMTTIHRVQPQAGRNHDHAVQLALQPLVDLTGDHIALTKGAVDTILDACQYVWNDDRPTAIDNDWRQRIETANEEFASNGMRVLGVAFRPLDQLPDVVDADTLEQQLIFVGMLGLIDPPRREAAEAVARCRTAGIRPVMITGDHPLTARYIAGQLHVGQNGDVLTGQDIDRMSADTLREAVETTSIYARVAPKHKLQLVRCLQEKGHVVAMTGDGVNDAPALKQAHIGVAMGITGTDVSKEASQMVLLDDNFATIVTAVEQGRIVYDNIRKFVKYTMTSNAGEIWVMILGPLFGMPLPLLPLQILWINLVTDGLPGLALAVERGERDTMQRPPYPREKSILGGDMARDIAWIGLLMGVASLAMGYYFWRAGTSDDAHWRTIIFTTLTLSQMGNALAIRSDRDSLFRIGPFSNPFLIASIGLTFALQLLVVYWRPMQVIFDTTSLTGVEFAFCVAISTIVFWSAEIQKWWLRRYRTSQCEQATIGEE